MTQIVTDLRDNPLLWQPTGEEQEFLSQIRRDWNNAENQKNRSWRQLRDINVNTFMQRSRDHYNGYVPPASVIDDEWKSRAFKRKTRNKVTATVAGFLASGVGIDIGAQNFGERLDRKMSEVVDDLYEWSLERENFDYTLLRAFMEMIITGTVHMQEEIVWNEREVKEITDINFETGEVKFEKNTRTEFKGTKAEFIPNDELYPGDAWTHDIQDQPYVIRRKITTYEDAMRSFDKFDNWEFVMPGTRKFLAASGNGEGSNDAEDNGDEDSNEVEVVWYWSKADDIFAIIVNSVLLTPVDNPFPYPHKQYPIAKSVFETFADSRFYWGDSLPNKNWDDQEVTNQLWNMFIDSTKLKNKPPLFTPNAELAGTDLIIPGAISASEDSDKITTIPEITRGVSNSEFNMLQLIENQIDENTLDPLLGGQTPSGDPTATEIRAIIGASERTQGLNDQFIGNFLIQHARLRIPNLLWFLSHDEEYQKIVLDKVKGGSKGGKRIITFALPGDIPTPDELFKAETLLKQKGMPMDFVFVDKDQIENYRFHIDVSATKRPARTTSSKIARVFSKFRLYSTNELIDQVVNTRKLVEALGDDPDEVMQAPQITIPQPGTELPQTPQTLKTPPGSPALEAQLDGGNILG